MSQSKGNKISQPSMKAKVITLPLILLFGVCTLVYYLVLAAIYTLFGERLASWLSNPLFGIAVFFITKWEGTRKQQDIAWRDIIRFPKLKIWKLILIILTIFSVQLITGLFAGMYLIAVQPEIETDGILEAIHATTTEWGSLIIALTGGALAWLLGGYVAGKLSPYKYLAPYSHAAAGQFIFYTINYVWIQVILVCECGTPPTQEDLGIFVLLLPPTMLLSLFGAWVATKTRLLRRLDAIARSFGASLIATRKQLSGNNEYADSLSSSYKSDTNSEPLVEHTLSEQHATGISLSKFLKTKHILKKHKRRKKRKRR